MSPVSATYWSVSGYVIFWVLFAIAFGLFAQRVYFLFRLLRLGQAENRFDRMGHRIKSMLFETIFQWCSLKSVSPSRRDLAGLGHAILFFGLGLFLIGYIIDIGLLGGFGLSPVLAGSGFNTFKTVYHSILDIAALFVIIAIVWATIRHYIIKPERLQRKETTQEKILMPLLFIVIVGLMVLHYCMDGFRYAAYNISGSWPLIGVALADFLTSMGISQATLVVVYKSLWWLNYVILLGALIYTPRSKHLHPLVSFPNIVFKSLGPKGALKLIDLEQAETFGVAKIQDFTWKNLLDLYTCTVCGRCHANCPAQLSGQPLSPREVILNLKEHLLRLGPQLLKVRGKAETANPGAAMIGEVVSQEVIWECTTCRACQEVCPVSIEQMVKIIDMRRNLVLERAEIPETAAEALRSIEARGHPWRGTTWTRTDWAEGLDIKILADDSDIDILFWVGCTAALEDRSMNVARSMARLLKLAGINFGILGTEESCCGDPARRLGNEYLFQLQAQKNIELMKNYNVKKIVTVCPHCYNTLKNEYPQLGGEFEVIHHTELIANWLKEDRLRIIKGAKGVVTYHDACYLGRYNDIFEPPRQILNSMPDITLVETKRNRELGFCCGGGGGHMWLEEHIGRRINEVRTEQIIDTKAQIVVTACPFCLQMFEDGIKAKAAEQTLKVMDIAELVAESAVCRPYSAKE